MSHRSRHQYMQQKQFTDHASHEMQTPLSVLSFELDQLQQYKRLNEAELERIQRCQQVVKRLSSLNRSLLLLAKIDNQQFAHQEPVDLGALLSQLLASFGDYAAHQGISITWIIGEGPIRSLNQQLAENLFTDTGLAITGHQAINSLIKKLQDQWLPEFVFTLIKPAVLTTALVR